MERNVVIVRYRMDGYTFELYEAEQQRQERLFKRRGAEEELIDENYDKEGRRFSNGDHGGIKTC